MGEKITGASCEAYVFFLKTVPVIFFGALAKEWQLKCKTSFLKQTKKNVLVIITVISEMKQTNT
ncbi:MAG: hypothetical protein C0430_11240 [Flavobacterium sp.]|nr:hypothetical protein [Flavobacterium sp.]